MMKTLLALGAAAVTVSAVPADARHAHMYRCTAYRHHHCVSHAAMVRHHAYRVGYVFGPHYGYTAYTAVPRTYRVRYHLNPDDRYVYSNGYVYVVDPTTYAITRILNAI